MQDLATRFVDLANAMKNEGHAPDLVNGSLMFASCIYKTFSEAGNERHLQILASIRSLSLNELTWRR